jgi:creatinine amidohydrolase
MIDFSSVRAELMAPHEIEARLTERSLVFVPVGSLEYHQEHLPIGLDALNAHGVCLAAAEANGGVVLPPLFYGTGGGHISYPWTIMAEDTTAIRLLLELTLKKLAHQGVAKAVIFTGHFADEQLELIHKIAEDWNLSASSLRAIAASVNLQLASHLPAPDHAGIFETTLLANFWPETIHLEQLPPIETHPRQESDADQYGLQRHDADNPLRGIFGPDPRGIDMANRRELLAHLVSELSRIAE